MKATQFKKGHIPWNRGKEHTEETKKKMSKARLERKKKLGYLNSPETRKKISETLEGQNHSPLPENPKQKTDEGFQREGWNSYYTKRELVKCEKCGALYNSSERSECACHLLVNRDGTKKRTYNK